MTNKIKRLRFFFCNEDEHSDIGESIGSCCVKSYSPEIGLGPVLAGPGCSNLILLASSQHNLYGIYHSCVYSTGLLMMDRKPVRNM